MPTVTTGVRPRDEYLRAVGLLAAGLRAAGAGELLVAYGFGCDCPDDRLYADVPVPAERLGEYIRESERAGFYRSGRDNLHVAAPAVGVELLLCHESDIHITTESGERLARLTGALADAGITGVPDVGWR
jgi:hypothetical protein